MYIESHVDDVGTKDTVVELSSLFDGLEHLEDSHSKTLDGLSFKCLTSKEDGYSYMHIAKSWTGLASQLQAANVRPDSAPVALVCGPRKVGKSTFARYLANSLLNKFENVVYLNLDVGQTDFLPSGFLSMHVLSSAHDVALVGPPYSHVCRPTHGRYIGNTDVGSLPLVFHTACLDLCRVYLERYAVDNIPIVINTMGWITGLGLSLLQSIVHTIRPSYVYPVISSSANSTSEPGAMVDSHSSALNFVWDALYGSDKNSRYGGKNPLGEDEPVLVAGINSSVSEDEKLSNARPMINRDLQFMSYFHQLDDGERFSFEPQIFEAAPFTIQFKDIHITIPFSGRKINIESVLPLLPLSLVGLTSGDFLKSNSPYCQIGGGLKVHFMTATDPLPECRDAGIIRAVDPVAKCIHFLTPIPLNVLRSEKLTTLVVTPGFLLPKNLIPDMMTSAWDQSKEMPYKDISASFSGGDTSASRRVRSNIQRKSHTPRQT